MLASSVVLHSIPSIWWWDGFCTYCRRKWCWGFEARICNSNTVKLCVDGYRSYGIVARPFRAKCLTQTLVPNRLYGQTNCFPFTPWQFFSMSFEDRLFRKRNMNRNVESFLVFKGIYLRARCTPPIQTWFQRTVDWGTTRAEQYDNVLGFPLIIDM